MYLYNINMYEEIEGILVFQSGGWIFIMKMQSPGVKKYQFSKKNRLQRAFTQLLVTIVVTNTINVNTT